MKDGTWNVWRHDGAQAHAWIVIAEDVAKDDALALAERITKSAAKHGLDTKAIALVRGKVPTDG